MLLPFSPNSFVPYRNVWNDILRYHLTHNQLTVEAEIHAYRYLDELEMQDRQLCGLV